jgi:uncharacterized membrane protein YdjX (TVP38/TMEM64 family)
MTLSKAQLGRIAVLGLLIIGIVAAWRWRTLFDPRTLTELIGRNPWAPLAFLALHMAASLFLVPRTLLALGAGMVFGMWWGIVWAALGSVGGAVAGFLVARYLHAGFTDHVSAARLAALTARVERGGWRMVAVVRLVPIIPHSLTNYALGLTRVPLGAYAFGSLLGQLPLTIAYADLGAAGERALLGGGDWPHEVLWPSLIGLAALALSLLIPAVARRRQRQVSVQTSVEASVPGAMPGA